MGPATNKVKLNPFPGLRPFLPEESDLFFGREVESEEVLRKLLKNRFITVIGASGSGKSSLIYCGVLPRVKKQTVNNSTGWKIITFRPGSDPMANLTYILTENIQGNEDIETVRKKVASVLASDPDGITRVIKELVITGNEKVLILVDQFEELFRYSNTGAGIVPGENTATFVTLLENAVNSIDSGIYSIITMRSDFIGECAHFQGFTQLINNSNYLVPHMNSDNYRAVIEGPVKYAGATIDPDLVRTLLNDIGDQTDQLPVLQHALMRTWSYWQELDEPDRPISFKDYDSVGTMSDAMSRHANEAFEELSQRGREICEKTFKTITEKGADNKGIRHPSSVKVIKSIIDCESEELFEVVGKFRIASRSFITPRENVALSDDSVIDLSHESLMRLWDRLKEWVDEEAASVQMYLRLSEASAMFQQGKTTLWRPPDLQLAINWRDQQKPALTWAERYDPAFERAMVYLRTSEKEYLAEEENKIMLQKRQMKRTRIVAIFLGTAAMISIAFMLFAFVQQIAADHARIEADNNAKAAQVQRQRADSANIEAQNQKEIAVSAAELARQKEAEAVEQKDIADYQKGKAVASAIEAQTERNRAQTEADSATRARQRAVRSAEIATEQKIEALRLRMLSIGKAMSIKSLGVPDKDLQTLLAYQAYLFNKRNKGLENDADIYQGLYNVARVNKTVNYKTFKGHISEIRSIAFIPGKREFFTSGTDKQVLKWNLDSKEQSLQVVFAGSDIIEVLAVSPDAQWLACGGYSSIIKMIPIKGGGATEYELKGHTGKIKSLIFSFDGKYLYSASLDGKVLKWDLAAKTSININTEKIQINYIDVSSGGKYIAGVSNDGNALIWNTETAGDNFRTPQTPGKEIKIVRFKPDANTLAIGYTDGYVELWDVTTKRKIAEVKAHTAEVNDIRFNNKEMQMATASNDKTLKIWDTSDLTALPITFPLSENEAFVLVIEFSPDGQMIVSGSYEGTNNLVARPTKVEMLTRDICRMLSRNMTPTEWSTYVAPDLPFEKTCSETDFSIKVNVIK